jgi:rhodanese-related sulfurtransferase
MSFQEAQAYAGDLSVEDAYAMLDADPRATLVDVRTQPEWQFVGVADLSSLNKEPIFLQWQTYPKMTVSDDFVTTLAEEMRRRGVDESAPIAFLCRSGVRSRNAAIAMTRAGWTRCYNIADGFEGGLDAEHHRGSTSGWRARGLPWAQT